MSFSAAFFKTGTYAVARPSGSYVKGRWTPGADSAFNVDADIQPAESDDLELLPEGDRKNSVLRVYTETALEAGDVMTIGSGSYKVLLVDHHRPFEGSAAWYRAIIGELSR